jgi:hypothetical protein
VVTWDIDYDPSLWLHVPEFDDEAETEQWLDEASESITEVFAEDFELPGEYREVLRHQLNIWAELARADGEKYGNLLAHIPGPDAAPAAVWVGFREPLEESPDYLLEIAGATGLPSVKPPTVEHIVTDDLGEGIRVLRYEQDDELGLIANLCYAWRAHGTDVFVFVQTADLARLEQMDPDLTALANAIHPVDDEDGTGR